MKLDLKEWINKIMSVMQSRPSWTYVGDVYWWANTWTVPDNGYLEIFIEPSGANWNWYISDSSCPDTGWSHRYSGNRQATQSHIIPVKKGAVLKTANMSGIGTAHCYYYKLNVVGGVVRKLLKALKPLTLGRGWAV